MKLGISFLIGLFIFASVSSAQTVLSDWGQIENYFPMNFKEYTLSKSYARIYYQNKDGTISNQSSKQALRACTDLVLLKGSPTEGAMYVFDARTVRGHGDIDECSKNNGMYGYYVTEDGAWLTSASGTVWMFLTGDHK